MELERCIAAVIAAIIGAIIGECPWQLQSTFNRILSGISVEVSCPVLNLVDTCCCHLEKVWVFSLLEHFVSYKGTLWMWSSLAGFVVGSDSWDKSLSLQWGDREKNSRYFKISFPQEKGFRVHTYQTWPQKFLPLSWRFSFILWATGISLALLSEL